MEPHWSDEQEARIQAVGRYYKECKAYALTELQILGMSLEDAKQELEEEKS